MFSLRPAVLCGLAAALLVPAARAELLYAVDNRSQLISFDSDLPSFLQSIRPIRGLQPGEVILGIDVRPATGQLYALGSTARIYILNLADPASVFARPVAGEPFAPLAGTEFGFDFNPTVDRIRIVSNTGLNLRVHPDTGRLVRKDGDLAYAAPAAGQPAPPQATAIASAYTNSFAGATTTTLYNIEAARGMLVTQDPPNDGVLKPVAPVRLGFTQILGFDISGRTGVAYLMGRFTDSRFSQLYRLDLATGAATMLGETAFDQISALAVAQ